MLVSIIIPTYNVQDYIVECVESCYAQTYKNIQVICIDNNSTDDTRYILKEIKIKYPSLIIDKETKPGAPYARNKGLKIANGEYIQFLDADDIIEAIKIEQQVEHLLLTGADVVVSDRIVKNETLEIEKERFTFQKVINNSLETAIVQIIITGNPLYKKSIVEKIGGYNENLESAQDWDFHIRLVLSNAKFVYLPGFFFISRDVENSLSSDWIKVSLQASKVILSLSRVIYKNDNITNEILNKFYNILYNTAIHCDNYSLKKEIIEEMNIIDNIKEQNKSVFKRIIKNYFGYITLLSFEKFRTKI